MMMMPWSAMMLEWLTSIWSPKTTMVPFAALKFDCASILIRLEIMSLDNAAFKYDVMMIGRFAGGAVAGGANIEPLLRLFITPRFNIPPCTKPSTLMSALIISVAVLPAIPTYPPLF